MSESSMLCAAKKMLEKCDSVSLASITEDGYPRICEMEKVSSVGLKDFYFLTLKTSQKVKHFTLNPKASIGFCVGNDSVSLIGNVSILSDQAAIGNILPAEYTERLQNRNYSDYCVLHFAAVSAKLFIAAQFETIVLSDSSVAVTIRKAAAENTPLTIALQDAAFEEDFLRYGSCPSYHRMPENMSDIILYHTDYLIFADGVPCGNAIIKLKEDGRYRLNSLGVIPGYRGKGVGSEALRQIESTLPQGTEIILDTPANKSSNISFYKNNGYAVVETVCCDGLELVLFSKIIK